MGWGQGGLIPYKRESTSELSGKADTDLQNIEFPFPTNGKEHFKEMDTSQIKRRCTEKVSIPYERERAFQEFGLDCMHFNKLHVSIPYERERAFQARRGLSLLRTRRMVSIPYERERAFQEPEKHYIYKMCQVSIPYERERAFQGTGAEILQWVQQSFNSLRTGKSISSCSVFSLMLVSFAFQFPTNGKEHFKLIDTSNPSAF